MKTKILSSILVIVFFMASLGISALAAEKPKIRFWPNRNWSPDYAKEMEALGKKFSEMNNCEVEVTSVPWVEVEGKLASAVEAKNEPDIFQLLGPQYVPIYVKGGVLMPLDDVWERIGKNYNDWTESARLHSFLKGHIYTLPSYDYPAYWYFRKDKLDEHNLAVPTNWDEFIAAAQKVQNPKKNFWGFGEPIIRWSDTEIFFRDLLWSMGGKLVESDAKTIAFNSPETVRAVSMVADMFHKYKIIPPAAVNWDGAGNNVAYQGQRAFAIYNQGSVMLTLKKKGPELYKKTIVRAALEGPKGRFANNEWVSNMASARTKHPELVKKFLLFLYEETNYKKQMELLGGGCAPPFESLYDLPTFTEDPNSVQAVLQSKLGKPIGWPGEVTEAASAVRRNYVMGYMLIRACAEKMSPEKAVAEATKEIEQIYEKFTD